MITMSTPSLMANCLRNTLSWLDVIFQVFHVFSSWFFFAVEYFPADMHHDGFWWTKTRWWFQIFYMFTPTWGDERWSNLTKLKPPTRKQSLRISLCSRDFVYKLSKAHRASTVFFCWWALDFVGGVTRGQLGLVKVGVFESLVVSAFGDSTSKESNHLGSLLNNRYDGKYKCVSRVQCVFVNR